MAKEKETVTDVIVPENITADVVAYFGDGGVPQQDGIELKLATIKAAHQSQAWEMPDGEMVKKFKGIILHIQNMSAFWIVPFDQSGGGSPPTCSSDNGIRPNPNSEKIQANVCNECKHDIFGSDGKRGKACKNFKVIFIRLPGYTLPVKLAVPPTSIRSVNEYGSALANKGITYVMVETEFSLRRATNKDGIVYSELSMNMIGPSAKSKQEADTIMGMKKDFYDIMVSQEIKQEDYAPIE